jgi:hypothetical protein
MMNPNEFWSEVSFAIALGAIFGYVFATYF